MVELTLEQILAITSVSLACLLATSEALGWAKCDANAISQLLFKRCAPQPTSPV